MCVSAYYILSRRCRYNLHEALWVICKFLTNISRRTMTDNYIRHTFCFNGCCDRKTVKEFHIFLCKMFIRISKHSDCARIIIPLGIFFPEIIQLIIFLITSQKVTLMTVSQIIKHFHCFLYSGQFTCIIAEKTICIYILVFKIFQAALQSYIISVNIR